MTPKSEGCGHGRPRLHKICSDLRPCTSQVSFKSALAAIFPGTPSHTFPYTITHFSSHHNTLFLTPSHTITHLSFNSQAVMRPSNHTIFPLALNFYLDPGAMEAHRHTAGCIIHAQKLSVYSLLYPPVQQIHQVARTGPLPQTKHHNTSAGCIIQNAQKLSHDSLLYSQVQRICKGA